MERNVSLLLAVVSTLFMAASGLYEPEPVSYTCCASGDPHYELFDGDQWIHFQGECKYLLAGTCNCSQTEEPFHVFVDNEPVASNPLVFRTDLVEIHYKGHIITFQAGQYAKIDTVVNLLTTPYTGIAGSTVSKPLANKFVFETEDGLIVSYENNHRVCVTVPCKYRDNMCGICGNMNNFEDDYVTSTGVDVSGDPNKYSLIGNSWEVAGGDCPVDYERPQVDYEPRQVDSTCCEGLYNSAVQDCAMRYPLLAEGHYQSCLIDAGADPENPMSCCAMVEAFVSACRARGVPIAGSSRESFPQCSQYF